MDLISGAVHAGGSQEPRDVEGSDWNGERHPAEDWQVCHHDHHHDIILRTIFTTNANAIIIHHCFLQLLLCLTLVLWPRQRPLSGNFILKRGFIFSNIFIFKWCHDAFSRSSPNTLPSKSSMNMTWPSHKGWLIYKMNLKSTNIWSQSKLSTGLSISWRAASTLWRWWPAVWFSSCLSSCPAPPMLDDITSWLSSSLAVLSYWWVFYNQNQNAWQIFLSGGHLGFHHPGHLRLGRIKLEGRPGHQQASESQSSHWIPQVIFCLSCCFPSPWIQRENFIVCFQIQPDQPWPVVKLAWVGHHAGKGDLF